MLCGMDLETVRPPNQLGGQPCTMCIEDEKEVPNKVFLKRGNSSSYHFSMKFPHPCKGYCNDMST